MIKLCFSISDERQGYCFRKLVNGRCSSHSDGLMAVTKADCCCTMGKAWGPHCEICPNLESDEYKELCLDPGYSIDGHGINFFYSDSDLY